MKELTIEQKAKAYDEAIEKLRSLHDDYDTVSTLIDIKEELEYIFPEFKESEDEKVRKALVELVKCNERSGYTLLNNVSTSSMLDWLEKQGEQKPADNFKQKFKVGDWVVHDMSDGRKVIRQIVNITNKSYVLDGEDFNTFYFNDLENNYHLWTIQDAKNGDVLAEDPIEGYPSSFVAIYKKQNGEDFDSYCFVGFDGKFYKGENGHSTEEIHPATKEQRDTLFAKIKEEGYEWSEDTHELKKISQRMVSAEAKEALYDKPTDEEMKELLRTEYEKGRADAFAQMQKEWSEEDECTLNGILDDYKSMCKTYRNWLESLKNRIQPQQKQERSEEDEVKINRIVACLENLNIADNDILLKDVEWLKSLKERYTWKPKTWEIQILESVIEKGENPKNYSATLHSILEQLKKLKGE